MDSKYSYISGLECSKCGKTYSHTQVQGTCQCGAPLLVRYDLDAASETFKPEDIEKRPPSLWRYHEILPVEDQKNVVSLGEGMTPLLDASKIGTELGMKGLLLKDEGLIPTGTFKARGAAVGVSKCKELGVKRISMPTNGNAGAAWSTYAARAGIESYIVMPLDAPKITRAECYETGAQLYLVNGLISDAGGIVKKASQKYNFFDVSTLKEPYRIEGKKTMGLEIVEQLKWNQPDVVLYPTGGGVGIIGIYKALIELKQMGIIDEIKTRFVAVQAEGCAPIVRAFEEKKAESEFWKDSKTIAFGINVPKALGDFLVLDAVYKTGGTAIQIPDAEILKYQKMLASTEGMFICPEGASTIAAAKRLRDEGWIDQDEVVVALNTGSGMKYPDTVNVVAPTLQPGDELKL